MLDNKSQGPCQASPNCYTWNARGFCEFPQRRERGFIKGFENCVVDNLRREIWVSLRFLRPAARRAQVGDHCRVCDSIGAEYLHKFNHGSPGPKGPSCRDRDKWCADPLCSTLTFNIIFGFSRKETNSARSPKQMRKFHFSEKCLYHMGYEAILLDSKPGE
jgi:hypothetical protein